MINDLDDFKIYNLAMKIGEDVWSLVSKWNYFDRDVMGKQLIRAVDSIAANLSEGPGRYHFKETKNFSYFARGSMYETKKWLKKANARKLVSDDTLRELLQELDVLGRRLNTYIGSLHDLLKKSPKA